MVTQLAPIGLAQRREVLAATQRCIALAGEAFGTVFPGIPVQFDLAGSAAGIFQVRGRRCWIRYNPWIFSKYFNENLIDTVAHEVAHYIVHAQYGRRGIKPHGREWRAVMAVLEVHPNVTFNLDLSGVPRRRQRTHRYCCSCRDHELSSTRHNRISRGSGRYQCRYCNQELTLAPERPG